MDNTETQIFGAKLALDLARTAGDLLRIDLAEAALNQLLDRYRETLVTRNQQKGQPQ